MVVVAIQAARKSVPDAGRVRRDQQALRQRPIVVGPCDITREGRVGMGPDPELYPSGVAAALANAVSQPAEFVGEDRI